MPYVIRKVRKQDCYKVSNKKTKKVYAKCSTLENAKKQVRLLQAIEKNASFKKKLANNRKTRKK
tara:strand:+ start:111 stop:302 length:192 start_codon:yes stop_codon:yes gene_type:complete